MATYLEIAGLIENDGLKQRIAVACIVACEAIRAEAGAVANHDARVQWAGNVLRDPRRMAQQMWLAVLAQNNALTLAQITAATDAQLQTAVNNAVDLCALSLQG